MAKNGPKGNGRKGMIKNRSQVKNLKINRYIKRNSDTGQFISVKSDNKPFKSVRKEK
ncbi:hypothetical protein L2Z53_02475 [Macrococcoides canis]|uniref:hypothetical protein n=1 Tax=Macrococcoides canis TaxID=1855823 RepID=UPI001F432C47|nr:hypothetical protein [Macrococcus canis]UJS28233.1 hypothetical protein L2Z53_02475 [Macrococcus canis]